MADIRWDHWRQLPKFLCDSAFLEREALGRFHDENCTSWADRCPCWYKSAKCCWSNDYFSTKGSHGTFPHLVQALLFLSFCPIISLSCTLPSSFSLCGASLLLARKQRPKDHYVLGHLVKSPVWSLVLFSHVASRQACTMSPLQRANCQSTRFSCRLLLQETSVVNEPTAHLLQRFIKITITSHACEQCSQAWRWLSQGPEERISRRDTSLMWVV